MGGRDGGASMRPISAERWGRRVPIGKGAKPGARDSDFSITSSNHYKF